MLNIRNLSFIILLIVLISLVFYFNDGIKTGFEYAYSFLRSTEEVEGTKNAFKVEPWSEIKYEAVASNLDLPVFITNANDGSNRLFVIEKRGKVKIIKNGDVLEEPFLDIGARVRSRESERGLLSLVFIPIIPRTGDSLCITQI